MLNVTLAEKRIASGCIDFFHRGLANILKQRGFRSLLWRIPLSTQQLQGTIDCLRIRRGHAHEIPVVYDCHS